jgi:AhpD family alkylhydroperoxidase
MGVQERIKEMRILNGRMIKTYPELIGPFMAFIRKVEEKGALDPKTKALIAVSLSVALKCECCIAFHTKSALDHGATPNELIESCMVATFMAGTPAMMNIRIVLESIDEFRKK